MSTKKKRLSIVAAVCSILLLCIIATAVFFTSTPSREAALSNEDTVSRQFVYPESVYNYPYAEVIAVYRSGVTVTLEIFNTTGVADYVDTTWSRVDSDVLAQELGADMAVVNAPKYWLVDSIKTSKETGDTTTLESLDVQMNKVNTIDGGAFGRNFNQGAYLVNTINSSLTFIWNEGTEVSELISPSGDIYRMQSYSRAIDSTLSLDSLDQLGTRLELPDGWQYRTRVLDTQSIHESGQLDVMVDELGNTYQLIET